MGRVPDQRFDSELLDGPLDDPEELRVNLRDMALANRLLLSNRSVLRRIASWLSGLPVHETPTVLDVATGSGGLARAVAHWARSRGRRMRLVASDIDPMVMRIASRTLPMEDASLVRHDALRMPFADQSIEIVTCAFSLHHFGRDAATRLLREMARVARLGVVVSDLRRSYIGYWGARLLALGPVSPLSRHDGPLSVLRAYTPLEAQGLIEAAGLPGRALAEPIFRVALTVDTRTL